MVELERTILPALREHMSPWKRYIDDTISYIKEESIEHVLSKSNGFHDNIEFTYEIENDGRRNNSKVFTEHFKICHTSK